MWAYSLYLDGERRKEQALAELAEPLERRHVSNPRLGALERALAPLAAAGRLDGFALYAYGIVLKELRADRPDLALAARATLWAAVQKYPWNWSAWLDLVELWAEADVAPLHELSLIHI